VGANAGDVLAPELHEAATGVKQPEDRLDQGRLAGAIGADHGDYLTLLDFDRDTVEDVDFGDVARDQFLGVEERLSVEAH
jgi:hypothetical protein